MSAPQIPHLLSGRGTGRGRGSISRGRGRGRGGPGPGPVPGAGAGPGPGPGPGPGRGPGRGGPVVYYPPRFATPREDRIVKETDTDANNSRISAVIAGYLNDDYAKYFNPNGLQRLPVINRGTYVRTSAIDLLIYTFLSNNDGSFKQIISLGAGTDTRFWRLTEDRRHNKDLIYHELDFPDITTKKLNTIARTGDLAPISDDADRMLDPESHGNFYSRGYNLHGLDLRDLPTMPWLKGVRQDIPTLLISECCLCYLDPQSASRVVDYFAAKIPNIGIIIYEPTNPTSTFGQMMKENLASRGLVMPTLNVWGSLDAQKERLRLAGFSHRQEAADIGWLWNRWLHPEEKARLDKIERLDECEEWDLLACHYMIAWGYRDHDQTGCFEEWPRLCPGPGSGPGY